MKLHLNFLNSVKIIYDIISHKFNKSFISFSSYAKAKVYGKSKTLSQEFQEYENCRLIKTLANVKDDGNKDGTLERRRSVLAGVLYSEVG